MFAKKSLGQNFLMHAQTAERIADAAHIQPDDTVLEIGPGTGMLTRALLERARRVIAVEADNDLAPQLEETFHDAIAAGKLLLIHGDIRSFAIASIVDDYRLVANIPYYLTGEIMRTFLTAAHKPRSITVLVQKEVAERIAREKKGSLLQIAVHAYGSSRYEFTVPRGAFKPAPKVDSAVLSIVDIRRDAFASPAAEEAFFEVLRAGFAHKRKFLAKNLEAVAPRAVVEEIFAALNFPKTIRAEEVSTEGWRALAAALKNP